jgi:hypothetical protein
MNSATPTTQFELCISSTICRADFDSAEPTLWSFSERANRDKQNQRGRGEDVLNQQPERCPQQITRIQNDQTTTVNHDFLVEHDRSTPMNGNR